MSEILYDPKCDQLARAFLGTRARPEHVKALAQAIQQAIEDYFTDNPDLESA